MLSMNMFNLRLLMCSYSMLCDLFCCFCMVCFFFFKQKTAYEMRISDWSSDVCSSDLPGADVLGCALGSEIRRTGSHIRHQRGQYLDGGDRPRISQSLQAVAGATGGSQGAASGFAPQPHQIGRAHV